MKDLYTKSLEASLLDQIRSYSMPYHLYYFHHLAAQRTPSIPYPGAGAEDKLLIRILYRKMSGSLLPSDEFDIESEISLPGRQFWVSFSDIKQFSSNTSIESKYTKMMGESLSSMGVPYDEHPYIIEKFFQAVAKAVSPNLPLDVGIWDVTCRMNDDEDEDECMRNFIPAAKSSIESLEPVELQDDIIRHTPSCAICLEDFAATAAQGITRLPCAHLYHVHCIVQCLEMSHLCPMCRHPMPTE